MRNRRNRFRSNGADLDTLHIIKIILEILIIIFLFIFIFSSINMKKNFSKNNPEIQISENTENISNLNTSSNENTVIDSDKNNLIQDTQSKIQNNEPQSTTIHMALTGDIMCHNTIYKDAYNSETETYDFSYIFEDIKYNIQTADISIRQPRNYFCWQI